MIPDFDENGNLPVGVHFCEWEEFVERFGYTVQRQRMITGLELAMKQLQEAGCRTIYINGSFVTREPDPNDFDACWDTEEVDMDYLRKNALPIFTSYNSQAQKSKYRGELYRSDEPVGDLGLNSFDFFQRDRMQNRKGIIAIDLMRWES
ncbi:unknown protein [Rivularia sp. IAM M-261]|nr:unknown protein [Calothrix sp. PCC 7716]GJD16664.1 unknown protein [Rivularia sp. IAM M-261]